MSDEPPELRASHGDRDRVVDTLRIAAGDGLLSAEELDTRLERALAARTRGELAELTADLAPATDDVLVIEQVGGKYVKDGHWQVPARIDLQTRMVRVTLDFTQAAITSGVLRIDTDLIHGRLIIVTPPGVVINTDGLTLTYSKLKLHTQDAATHPRLRIDLIGTLTHTKVIERRKRR